MVDKNWYVGRMPGGEAGAQVFPFTYVKSEKYVKETSHCRCSVGKVQFGPVLSQLSLNAEPDPRFGSGYFPER
jgi:hypothetical protein